MEGRARALMTLYNPTIRGLVNAVNVESIAKEDIVTILESNGQYVLLYYK